VDAYRADQIDLDKIKQEDLPKELRGKSKEELKKIIEEKYAERERLQKQIAELDKQRKEFVATEMKKKNLNDARAFDKAVRTAIRAQAKSKGYDFREESKK
jgi:hypothetical protein